jgi:hypothetical protein
LTANTKGKKTIIDFPSFPRGERWGVKEFSGGLFMVAGEI